MDVFQVAQHADDLSRAEQFYRRLLQSEPTGSFDPPGLLFFQVGSTRLLLERGAPSATVYLRVEDVAGTVERLRADGVEIVTEDHVIFVHADDQLGPAGHEEHQAFVRDSEGNLLGLIGHVSLA